MLTDYGKYGDTKPHDYYTELAQAFIDEQWDNGAAKTPENGGGIMEQDAIGCCHYHCIDAWVKAAVGDVTSGVRDSRDFLRMYFRDISHRCIRGQYYYFDDNYWLVNDYSNFNGISQEVGIRRCNNVMRIIDPLNGGIFEIPCVIDYDMTAPSTQVGRYIITPNNHAIVKVQGNDDTLRLFQLNTRYMFGGRPFKLLAYQNALNYDAIENKPTYLELDLYLDEEHDGDDAGCGIAYNGDYAYSIKINAGDMHVTPDSAGQLYATVMCNGAEVKRRVVWTVDNPRVMDVKQDGGYEVYGRIGDKVKITATLDGNPEVYSCVTLTIEADKQSTPHIVMINKFSRIRQNESIDFAIGVEYGGKLYEQDGLTDVAVEMLDNGGQYITIEVAYTATCVKVSQYPVEMRASAKIAAFPELDIEPVTFPITTVSMFG
mgnify:CR=1 FL=1|nr:MAG TPA_asm: head closure knob [Bacteriophage sp.]